MMAESDEDANIGRDHGMDNKRRRIRQIQPPQEGGSNREETYNFRRYNHNIAVDNRNHRFPNYRSNSSDPNRFQYPSRSFNFQSRNIRNTDYKKQMSFREFVLNQDDKITPDEALSKYQEYCKDFLRRQYPSLFEKFSSLEWFRLTYHPYYKIKSQIKHIKEVKARAIIFFRLQSAGLFKSIILNDSCSVLVPFLDLINYALEQNNTDDIINKFNSLVNLEQSAMGSSSLKRKYTETSGIDTDIYRELRNVSIQIDNLPLEITKKQIISMIKNITGFVRVILFPPEDLMNSYRKAILTFSPQSDPKRVLDTLNELNFGETKPNISICYSTLPVIRLSSGPWEDFTAILSHLELLISMINILDTENFSYSDNLPQLPNHQKTSSSSNSTDAADSESDGQDSDDCDDIKSCLSMHDQMIEEAVKFKSILLEEIRSNQVNSSVIAMNVVDTLVFYLRIVHSFDFYTLTYYPDENQLPLKVQNIGIRKCEATDWISAQDISSAITCFQTKANTLLSKGISVVNQTESCEDLKDEKEEIEKFVEQSSISLSDGSIWQCKLCEKKFSGKDYLNKHLQLKHSSEIEIVKTNTTFFNNFMRDRKSNTMNTDTPNFKAGSDSGFNPRLSVEVAVPVPKKRQLIRYSDLNQPDVQAFDF